MRDARERISPSVLKILRDRFDLTLVELGRESEINISTLSLFENGKGKLSEEASRRLEAALIQALRKIQEKEQEQRQREAKKVKELSDLTSESMPSLSSNLVTYAIGMGYRKKEDS